MAKLVDVESIGSYFESLSDPRHTRNRKHLLVDIVVIAVCGMVCGCDGPTAIHRWAKHRADWLAQFLALPNGIPSRDCIRRLLMALKPEAFQKCFQDWIAHAIRTDDDEPGPARRHRRQDLPRLPRRGQRPRPPAHRQRLGQRGRDRPGPGRHRGEVQRDHGHPPAPGADRSDRHADHDRRHGLPEGDRRAHRRRRRRLRDRRQGQPAEAPRPRSRRTSWSTWSATWRTSGIGATRRATTGTAGSTSGRTISTRVPRDFAPKKEWPWIKAIGYAVRVTQHADGRETDEVRYYILQPLSQRQAVQRGGARPLGHRVDALGAGRELPRGRQPHPRADAGQQPELAAALRRDPAEASSRSRTASAAR